MSNIVTKDGALQSLKLYRMQRCFNLCDEVLEVAINALEEVQQLHAIGTVSEFRELKEKATAKAPYLFGDGYFDGVPVYDEWNCPNCDVDYEVDFEHHNYCPMCGQHIDWSEGKE